MSLIESICDELDLISLEGCAPADLGVLQSGLNLLEALVKHYSAGEYISPREATGVFHLMNLLRAAVNDSRRKNMFELERQAFAALGELDDAAEQDSTAVEEILGQLERVVRDAVWAFNDECRLFAERHDSSDRKVMI